MAGALTGGLHRPLAETFAERPGLARTFKLPTSIRATQIVAESAGSLTMAVRSNGESGTAAESEGGLRFIAVNGRGGARSTLMLGRPSCRPKRVDPH